MPLNRLFPSLAGDADGGAGEAQLTGDIDAAMAASKGETADDTPRVCDTQRTGLRHQVRDRKFTEAVVTVEKYRPVMVKPMRVGEAKKGKCSIEGLYIDMID